jgi:hypothetical protein
MYILNDKLAIEWKLISSKSDGRETVNLYQEKHSKDIYYVSYANGTLNKFAWYNNEEKIMTIFVEKIKFL